MGWMYSYGVVHMLLKYVRKINGAADKKVILSVLVNKPSHLSLQLPFCEMHFWSFKQYA